MSANSLPNYYEVLGIEKTATKEEIKNAYRESAKKYHPDNNNVANASFFFKMINDANETLGDDERRKRYDEELAAPKSQFTSADEPSTSDTELDMEWILDRDTVRRTSSECTYAPKLKNPFFDALTFCFRIIAKILMVPATFFVYVFGVITFMLSKVATVALGIGMISVIVGLLGITIERIGDGGKGPVIDFISFNGQALFLGRIFGENRFAIALIVCFLAMSALIAGVLISEGIPLGIFMLATKMFNFIMTGKKPHPRFEDMTYNMSTKSGKKKFSCFYIVNLNGKQYVALTPKETAKAKSLETVNVGSLLLFRLKLNEDLDVTLTNVESNDEFNNAFKKLVKKTA